MRMAAIFGLFVTTHALLAIGIIVTATNNIREAKSVDVTRRQ
jgi:hypothetical protein